MHKFLIRAASGIVYAGVIILAILFGQWTIYALALIFSVIGTCELNYMALGYSRRLLPVYVFPAIGGVLLISIFQFSLFIRMEWILGLIVLVIALIAAYYQSVKKILGVTFEEFINSDYRKVPLFSIGYPSIPLAFMTICPIERLPLLIFALLWINDSGAYIVGSLTGRHKLYPSISPNKTWEGFIGGTVLTLIGTFILDRYCAGFFGMTEVPLWIWMLIGISTCVFGTIGDLIESKIKRYYGVKDSGHWIPGHGGILDRIDSFLVAFPAAFFLLYLLHRM